LFWIKKWTFSINKWNWYFLIFKQIMIQKITVLCSIANRSWSDYFILKLFWLILSFHCSEDGNVQKCGRHVWKEDNCKSCACKYSFYSIFLLNANSYKNQNFTAFKSAYNNLDSFWNDEQTNLLMLAFPNLNWLFLREDEENRKLILLKWIWSRLIH
jgi:hypothetical protein